MSQRERILEMLEEAGDKGCSNYVLNPVAFRYAARLKELRDEGHRITSVKGKNKSEWVYKLIPEEKQVSMF